LLNLIYRKSFEKDLKRIKKRQKDVNKLKIIITLLLKKKSLPIRCRDHALTGNYQKHRECHIEPDWLLIYKSTENSIILERTGSHADLFR
jgi:mRNA interferase YafQ